MQNDYRSKFEVKIARQLAGAGVHFTYETFSYEYDESLRKNMARCADCGSTSLLRTGWYTPDFFLETGFIVETKGRFTAADRRKMIAIKQDHPDLNIVMCFMRNNRLSKQSKTKYSDWCNDHGYEFSIGTLKEEWLHGKEKETTPT